jgi:phage terminase large subunit
MALCAEAIKLSLKWPGNRGYFCRHELVTFRKSSLVTFEKVCPMELIKAHYREERIILFRNGSEIVYGGLGGEEDLEKIKSTEFGWFAIDEATETFEEMFLLLCSRLRWTLPDGSSPKYRAILASNPEPGWVKDRFVDQNLPDHAFIPALPKDNPHLPNGYDENLRKHWPSEWVKRYLEGSWDVFTGQVYTEFDRRLHVYREIEMGSWWERIRIIDHGYNNPTCCIWAAIDHDGNKWIYDEHYEKQMTIREHAPVIKARQPHFRGLTLGDPSMFSNTMQREGKPWSPADEYRSLGIPIVKPYGEDGWMSEGMGINLVKQDLKAGKIHVHESCENTIKEFLKYRWRTLKSARLGSQNAPEQPVDKDNHAMDCVRYLEMWRPPNSTPPDMPPDPKSLHFAIMKHKNALSAPYYVGWN